MFTLPSANTVVISYYSTKESFLQSPGIYAPKNDSRHTIQQLSEVPNENTAVRSEVRVN